MYNPLNLLYNGSIETLKMETLMIVLGIIIGVGLALVPKSTKKGYFSQTIDYDVDAANS